MIWGSKNIHKMGQDIVSDALSNIMNSLKVEKTEIKIEKVAITENYSFLDYIFGGCEISMQVAIDFTASNGSVN